MIIDIFIVHIILQLISFLLNTWHVILLILLMSSVFPISMLAYQIFQRDKQLKELRREFRLLGIDNSISEEKFNRSYSFSSFFLQMLLPTVLTTLGVIIIFTPHDTNLPGINDPTLVITALRYGFLGAYLYSIQLIYRRYTTMDLQPAVYMNCALTLIAGFAFNFTAFVAFSKLSGAEDSKGVEAGIFAIVAFSLGYFPLLAIRWFNQITSNVLGTKDPSQMASLPLSVIDGISQLHETRLRDEGIDNVQNLACAKIDEILINTRFNAQQVLEWVDQAILHSYVNPGSMDSFRRGGVRKISDFQDIWEPYYFEPVTIDKQNRQRIKTAPEGLNEARKNRALQLQSTPEYLDSLFLTSKSGPNIDYIGNYWPNQKALIKKLSDVAYEDETKKAQTLIAKTLSRLFEEICQSNLSNETRAKIGHLAKVLAPEPNHFVLDENMLPKTAEGLAGLGWWLWWLHRQDKEVDLTKEAAKIYDKAVEAAADNPRIAYESAIFNLLQAEDYKKAQGYAEQAVRHLNGADETGFYNNSLALLALTNQKAGNSKDVPERLKEFFAKIYTAQDGQTNEDESLRHFEEITVLVKDSFNKNRLPTSPADLEKKFEVMLEGVMNRETIAG